MIKIKYIETKLNIKVKLDYIFQFTLLTIKGTGSQRAKAADLFHSSRQRKRRILTFLLVSFRLRGEL